MQEKDLDNLVQDLEKKISKGELKKEEILKINNKLEIEKGVLENSLASLQKELKDEFGLENLDKEILEDLIKDVEKQLEDIEDDE